MAAQVWHAIQMLCFTEGNSKELDVGRCTTPQCALVQYVS